MCVCVYACCDACIQNGMKKIFCFVRIIEHLCIVPNKQTNTRKRKNVMRSKWAYEIENESSVSSLLNSIKYFRTDNDYLLPKNILDKEGKKTFFLCWKSIYRKKSINFHTQ